MLKIQASSVSRIIKCPASCTLESNCPKEKRYFAFREAADYGTACHAAGESALRFGVRNLKKLIGEHPRADDIYFTATEYAKAINANSLPKSERIIEEKYRATIAGIDCVAKADCKQYTKNRVREFDLKSGRYDYAESAGAQMLFGGRLYCYINKFPDGTLIDTFTIQPMFFNEARRTVQTEPVEYSKKEFVAFVKDIASRQTEFNMGSHCKMCGAILTCDVVKNKVKEVFEMAKKDMKEIKEYKQLYEIKDAVITFLDALDSFVKQELETGRIIDGLYLEEYSGHRKWIDMKMVEKKLAFLKDARYEPRKLKSPAQIEKLAGKENIVGLCDAPRLKRVAIRVNNFAKFEG